MSVLKEWELLGFLLSGKSNSVVHYLNAERDVYLAAKLFQKIRNIRFCGTFHKPPENLKRSIKNTSALRNLDGAIAVGTNQVNFLQEWLKCENVSYIPHGVDTEFFKPDNRKREDRTFLFVGRHLRDFETLNYCVPRISEKIKGVKFKVVVRPDNVKQIKAHACIELVTDVTDDGLRDLFNQCTLLFLPLKNATACNSILEGLSCGVPIISTDVGGTASYFEGTKNILVPLGDKDAYIEAVIKMIQNPQLLQEAGESSRQKALELDWKIIAGRIMEFYRELEIARQ